MSTDQQIARLVTQIRRNPAELSHLRARMIADGTLRQEDLKDATPQRIMQWVHEPIVWSIEPGDRRD